MKRKQRRRTIYVGFYDSGQNSDQARIFHLPATNKMDYICNAINATGRDVLIVSPSRTSNNHTYHGRVTALRTGVSLKLFPTFPWGNRVQRAASVVASHAFLFLFLLLNARRNEIIVVYHSLLLMRSVRYAKIIRGFRVLLEVEEIYQHAVPVGSTTAEREHATFRNADGFILSTELLNAAINMNGRPSTVVYGTYQVEPDRRLRFSDDQIHVVYAGIIDSLKNGAAVAASAAAHLDERYHVHIAGFGDERDIKRLQDQIAELSSVTKCGLSYDGLYTGNEFIDFLQKCDIGLSTQLPDAALNDTSFPSKLLSYMANGLAVVSVRIRGVEESKVARNITFYDGQDPQLVADAILSVRLPKCRDSRSLIEHLNSEFVDELQHVFDAMQRG